MRPFEEKMLEELDPGLAQLEAQHAAKTVEAAEEYEETEDNEAVEALEKAVELLSKSALLFEFLSDPDFCKNITNRERKCMGKLIDALYITVDELNATIGELQEEDE